jgi:Na+/H+ antiporter NhaC
MRFFPLVDFQHWVLAIFLGFVVLLLIYLSLGTHHRRPEEKSEPGEREIFSGQVHYKNPIPPLLIIVFLGVIVFALGYFLLIGMQGPPF